MRTLTLIFLLTGLSASTVAQEWDVRRDTVVTVQEDPHRVVTNSFWSNWFIGVGAGSQTFFGDHDKQMKFMDRQSFVPEFYLGKSFTPGVAVRAGINAGRLNGLTQIFAPTHSTGDVYDKIPWEGYWLEKQEIRYFHVHGDVLFNVSNLLGGYRNDRFYSVSPYVGLGWMVAYEKPKAREVSANIGVLNAFRVSELVKVTLDIRGASVNDRFDGEIGNRKEEGLLTALVGVKYRFKQPKYDWDQPTETVISLNEEDLAALHQAVKGLNAENDLLRKQLAEATSNTVTQVVVEKERHILAAPILITFPIDKWTVSNQARVNLGYLADVIKQGDAQAVYQITGYADQGTGSAKRNDLLSRERANAIYHLLVSEFGVSPSQLRKIHQGGVENLFYDDPRLSRAVIVVTEE